MTCHLMIYTNRINKCRVNRVIKCDGVPYNKIFYINTVIPVFNGQSKGPKNGF